MSNQLYNFRQILLDGIEVDDKTKLKINTITIPRLQRAYAQGRKSESDLRQLFLSDIFRAIRGNDILELNFVYGSTLVISEDDERDLELLDGQQRLTTLFLLHWYAANKELDAIPDFLKHFEYRTRTTSTDFVKELTSRKINFDGKPSDAIQKTKWFSYAFRSDATITAMLNMLDSIDDEYKKEPIDNFFQKLNNLQFYVLLLEGYGLSEELYIKMNARGLALTPFENFKSDLIKRMKSEERYQENVVIGKLKKHSMQYYLAFASKIDTLWIDLFWKKGLTTSKDYNKMYFRFFYRYFFIKYVLDTKQDLTAEEFRKDEGAAFFDDVSEKQQDLRYLHFNYYDEVLNAHPEKDYFRAIESILDVFSDCYETTIKPALQYRFEDNTDWDFFCVPTSYKRINAIAFAAVVEYIEACFLNHSAFSAKNFNSWMRVVWNLIENTNIDGISPQVALIRRLSELIHLPNATENIYCTLSQRERSGNDSRALLEEMDKAQVIVNDPQWEKELADAEKNCFLKGMVGFFFTPDITLPQFKHRYQIVSNMFSEDAISEKYREHAILIRAMLAQLNTWNGGLKDLSFTQRVEKEKYIKNILSSKDQIKQMFCRITDLNEDDIIPALVREAEPKLIDAAYLSDEDMKTLQEAYNRLCKEENMYNWMWQQEEWRKKSFRIQWLYGHVFVAIPYTTNARILLDSSREVIANKLMNDYAFYNNDADQQQNFVDNGFFYGYSIFLKKDYPSFKIAVSLTTQHAYRIYVLCDDEELRQKFYDRLFEKEYEPQMTEAGNIWSNEGTYDDIDDTCNEIMDAIFELEKDLEV